MNTYFTGKYYLKYTYKNICLNFFFIKILSEATKDISEHKLKTVIAIEITGIFDLQMVEDTFSLIQIVQNILSAHLRTHRRNVN